MKENVVFIRPPKIGGTSIALALGLRGYAKVLKTTTEVSGWAQFGHMHYPTLVKMGLVGEEFDKSAFKFSFVRNPYDRLVSMFFYYKQWWLISRRTGKRTKRWENKFETFLDFCRHIDSGPIPPLGAYTMKHNKKHIQSGYNPQYLWFEGLELDFLGRFEKMDEDYEKLSGILGIPYVKLPKVRTSKHDHYEKYYCPESLEIVNRIYGEDFERFNYPIHN